MLEALNLCCERHERTLFSDLSFTVSAGSLVHITGENGAGKTTLLRILAGLAMPEGGEVRWRGEPLARVREQFHQQLVWTGHRPGVKSRLTVRENVAFYHRASREALDEALRCVGLEGMADTLVARLSAGQQRRVALARLWLSHAPLWILDEPFTAIDAAGVETLTRHLEAHTQQGGAVIVTSHQPLAVARLQQIDLTAGASCC